MLISIMLMKYAINEITLSCNISGGCKRGGKVLGGGIRGQPLEKGGKPPRTDVKENVHLGPKPAHRTTVAHKVLMYFTLPRH